MKEVITLRVLIKGAGDIASGIAHRLHRARFAVIMTEIAAPTTVRRSVSFSTAVYEGSTVVEGVRASRVDTIEAAEAALSAGEIPVLVDPLAETVQSFKPQVVVDAILAKQNLGTRRDDAPLVIGIGPGFTAGEDVHAVIETMRGHDLGRVIQMGAAMPNTGIPGEIGGYDRERILRAPCDGTFQGLCTIGTAVTAGETVALVDGVPLITEIAGIVRGLLADGVPVKAGMKSGDIDPRADKAHCYSISDKARAIGGGVLEAMLAHDWAGR